MKTKTKAIISIIAVILLLGIMISSVVLFFYSLKQRDGWTLSWFRIATIITFGVSAIGLVVAATSTVWGIWPREEDKEIIITKGNGRKLSREGVE